MNNRVVTAHIPIDLAEQVDFFAARLDRPKKVGSFGKPLLLGLISKPNATNSPLTV